MGWEQSTSSFTKKKVSKFKKKINTPNFGTRLFNHFKHFGCVSLDVLFGEN